MSQRDAHENYAVAARSLHWIALVLVVVLAGTVVGMYLLWQSWTPRVPPMPASSLAPAPRLQVHAPADLAAARRHDVQRLGQYAWVDRGAGVARIPVARAMVLLAKPREAGK
ncbi:hypothetical protein [Pinirhizobacter sp.]|uniref:hypothetical protein n=1 Tax=Pinirhizobacter sp. TaxID=2950432 RepID=UPI002F3FE311